jgi:hypothetical protein
MTLHITQFISEHANDWEQRLSEPPFHVKAKRKDSFVLLEYSQYNSDFNLPIVRECRGIILEQTGAGEYISVCVPFFKFGNYGENYVPKDFDWESAVLQEKIDGSLIKVWFDLSGGLHISTNGSIDAFDINAVSVTGEKSDLTFGELFNSAWAKKQLDPNTLDHSLTYMFELVSPYNRIVVKHDDTGLYFLGARNNREPYNEFAPEDFHTLTHALPIPQRFSLADFATAARLSAAIEKAKRLDGTHNEGFVAIDRNFNRMKIKSPKYVELSHMLGGSITDTKLFDRVIRGETEELLTYFPEYAPRLKKLEAGFNALCERYDALFAADLRDFDAMTHIIGIANFIGAIIEPRERNRAAWIDFFKRGTPDTREYLLARLRRFDYSPSIYKQILEMVFG